MPPFDRWVKTKVGWRLANLFYDKTMRLPPHHDGAAWRILLAVQELRVEAETLQNLLHLEARYDTTGKKVAQTFQEWVEIRQPHLRGETESREEMIRRNLARLRTLGPMYVQPIRVSSWRSRSYAESLVKKTA